MLNALVLIFISLLIAPQLIVSREPDAQKFIDRIGPYQAWIGVIAVLWGAWAFLQTIFDINIIDEHFIWWITRLGGSILITLNGLLLGYAKINKHFLSRSPESKLKADEIMLKLRPASRLLAIAGVFGGLWMILAYIFFY
ncbi:MAG: hypothetical protein U9N85_04805 [Bacteroidota bacterium]|nr:hypothetical protein [Bacteroidota bacterium]